MSSEVEICNLALAHLGDSATVASINPPEGSSQAEHCQRWYPIARNTLLEMHDWGFATTRALLAEVVSAFPQWRHAYARPSDCLKVLAVLPADAASDSATTLPYGHFHHSAVQHTIYTPQAFDTETDLKTGNQIILTNQPNALVRYTRLVTDTSKFSPLFTTALARYLAHYLAGPVLKGETGIKIGTAQLQIAMQLVAAAATSSADQHSRQQVQAFPWSR